MSYRVGYTLVGANDDMYSTIPPKVDKMSAVATLNRIGLVVCQRIMLLMTHTELVKHRRLVNMDDVLLFLHGYHDDVGLYGDRGDFYRRKLAEQIFTSFAVHGVTHNNVMIVVEAAMKLERDTRQILLNSAGSRLVAPHVDIDDTVLDILSRIANLH